MSDPGSHPDAVENLVRAHLERQAQTIDPAPVYARLCASLAPATNRRRRWGRRLAWGMAAAAAVVLAFLGGWRLAPVRASAETLVQQAKVAHQLPLDRCYLVEVRRDTPPADTGTPPAAPRVIQLWTRGDRIWVESRQPQRRWAWGRDEHGNVWMAFGPHRAIRFTGDEVPPWLALGCDIFALRPETLLNDVLRDFALQRSSDGDGVPAAQVVLATLKPGHQHANLSQARIEIDAETKVIRRLVLTRTRQGQPFATITYTLAESRPQDDSQYLLEGHLAAPFEIYTPSTHPQQCQKTLDGWFDPRSGEPFHLPNPGK